MSNFEVPKPKLWEALVKDPEFKGEIPGRLERFESSPWGARYLSHMIKEGLTKDVAGALGRMHDTS